MEIFEKLMDLPHATLLSYAAIILALIAYLNGSLDLQQAFIASGISLGGAGVLGHARNGAGRGLKK